MLIAAGDENRVYIRVLQDPVVVGGSVGRAEAASVALASHAARGMNGAKANIREFLKAG